MIYGVLAALEEPAVWAVLAVTLVGAVVAGWWAYRTGGFPTPATVAAVLCLGGALALTVVPTEPVYVDGAADRWGWFVGQFIQLDRWEQMVAEFGRAEQVVNVGLFAPAAFFAVLATRRRVAVLIGGVVLVFAVESWQAVISFRSATAADVVANACGITIAVIIAAVVVRPSRRNQTIATPEVQFDDSPPVR